MHKIVSEEGYAGPRYNALGIEILGVKGTFATKIRLTRAN